MKKARNILLIIVTALATLATTLGGADPAWTGSPAMWTERVRTDISVDRYDMAAGCYTIAAHEASDAFVIREGDGFAAGGNPEAAEPFHFQATDLGRYLLFGSASDFLAVTEGAAAAAGYAVTDSLPGQIAGGVLLEQTDGAADTVASSPINAATGRGADIESAAGPSDLADWEIEGSTTNGYKLRLPATDQWLGRNPDGSLHLVGAADAARWDFARTEGCAQFPEIGVNVDGPVMGGATPMQEVRGFMDAHGHMMAFEFIGGRSRCGRPWHRFGVAHALVDCPDHHPGGEGALLEQALSGVGRHSTDGWPTFEGWPKPGSLTHEQVYYKWLERAWRGGQRLLVNLLVDNNQLCKVYPYKRNSCNEMDGVRLQAQRIRELERYIDAQSGGPGEGWFRIVTDPFQARRVMNEGRLAVVLGIEVSVPLDCGLTLDLPRCDLDQIKKGLNEVYDLGVRQMELVNKFDNGLSGVTGDSGTTGIVVNQGNLGETGRFWRMETCDEHDGHAHDKTQLNFHDQSGAPDQFSGRDSIFGAVLALFGTSGAAPIYPEGPHCNVLGLSALGEQMIREMVAKKMIFDPDHMSARARTQAMDLIEELEYSGVVSSHGWADDTIYPRIYEAGGFVAPHAGSSTSFVTKWRKHRSWKDDRFFFGIGFGADTNGFSRQGEPRGSDAAAQVAYPIDGFGGAQIHKQVSGTKQYDINQHGVAHYGLYPDWIQDVRNLIDVETPGQGDVFYEDLLKGAEAYLQMWERAVGVPPNACRSDVPDLTDAALNALDPSRTYEQVLSAIGQPRTRSGLAFKYCLTGGRTATVSFSPTGHFVSWSDS